MPQATRESSLGLCVAGGNTPGSLGYRAKDAMNHMGYMFMTNNPESLVSSTNEQNVKLDGSHDGRKGKGGTPSATLYLEAAG